MNGAPTSSSIGSAAATTSTQQPPAPQQTPAGQQQSNGAPLPTSSTGIQPTPQSQQPPTQLQQAAAAQPQQTAQQPTQQPQQPTQQPTQQQQQPAQPQQQSANPSNNTDMIDIQDLSPTTGNGNGAPAPDDNDPRSLLTSVADYEPSIPDAVTRYFLSKAGCSLADPELAKVVSLAAQLFVGELAAEVHDSVEIRGYSKTTSAAAASAKKEVQENKGTKMLASDLAAILRRRGLNVQKPEFQVP